MKWFILILIGLVGYAIYTNNMGGARAAAGNYNKLLHGSKSMSEPKN